MLTSHDDWKRLSQLSSLGLVGLVAGLFDNGGWAWPALLVGWTLWIAFTKTATPRHFIAAIIATATLWSALILAVASPSLLANDFAYYAIGAVVVASVMVILLNRSSSYKTMASAPKG